MWYPGARQLAELRSGQAMGVALMHSLSGAAQALLTRILAVAFALGAALGATVALLTVAAVAAFT
jgi:hypothetical protein